MRLFPAAVGSSSNTECVACDINCATCIGHASVCFSCNSGYVLFGTQCMTETYFEGSIIFGEDYPTFEPYYQSMLNNIRSSLGLGTLKQVYLTSFQPTGNEIILTFRADTNCTLSDTNCSTARMNDFTTLFSPPGFANVSVTNSSITITQFTKTTTNTSINTVNCTYPCSACDIVDGSLCTECIRGFFAEGGTCVSQECPVLYCQSC